MHDNNGERRKALPYSEMLIKPMREDLTNLGIRETRTPEEVDAAVSGATGTIMVVVNSVCGCAAGRARPGVALALQNDVRPQDMITVFAGADIEATERARSYFKGYRPSSPSIGLLRNGEPVFLLERHQIEGREAPEIAALLRDAFDQHCIAQAGQSAVGD
jgi:putative YphP/YqiW family bacilliredoxin